MMDEVGAKAPSGWTRARLGEVIEAPRPKVPPDPKSRLPFIGMDHIETGSFRLVGQDEFSRMRSAGSYFRAGDVLYGRLRPYLNKVHRAAFEGVASAEFIVFPESPVIDGDFLKFLLHQQAFVDFAMSRVSGDRPRVKFDALAEFEFLLPPHSEQRRIAEKIETLFAEVDKGEESLRQVQALLARYRQSVLKAAVTGELTADWRAQRAGQLEHSRDLLARILKARRENWQGRGKYKEPIEPDTTNLPELPEGWVWATIDQLLLHLTSGSRDWKQFYGRGNGVFIMAQNVRPMRFDLSERFSVDPPQSNPDAMRSEVRKDDLLVTIVGANTGDVCRFPLDATEHYVCQSVALLRMADTCLARFLEMYLSGLGGGREQIESFIYGAGRPHLSFEQLRGIHVALPPLGEQTEIERRVAKAFDQIERIQQACNQELARSAALRQSILKRAFSGTLVPQDPNDEPASELLARIRAQRAAQPGKTTRRKTAA